MEKTIKSIFSNFVAGCFVEQTGIAIDSRIKEVNERVQITKFSGISWKNLRREAE